jgi:hypothetical protein
MPEQEKTAFNDPEGEFELNKFKETRSENADFLSMEKAQQQEKSVIIITIEKFKNQFGEKIKQLSPSAKRRLIEAIAVLNLTTALAGEAKAESPTSDSLPINNGQEQKGEMPSLQNNSGFEMMSENEIRDSLGLAGEDQDSPETDSEKYASGLHYASPESAEKLKNYERFYPDLMESEVPIIVGYTDDIIKHADPVTKDLYKLQNDNIAAFTYFGSQLSPELGKKLGMEENAIYVQYGEKYTNPATLVRVAYHEGRHAKHYADHRLTNPEDKTLINRFPELSGDVNKYVEEIMTNSETLEFLEQQKADSAGTLLTEEEYEDIDRIIKEEKIYFRSNYFNYYRNKYGRTFNVPCGEGEPKDSLDNSMEQLFKKHKIIEIMGED